MNTHRTRFVQNISRCLGREAPSGEATLLELPNQVQNEYMKGASTEQLKSVFITNALAAGTAVHECTVESLNAAILAAISQLAEGTILLSDDPMWEEHQTVGALEKVHGRIHTWDLQRSREHNIAVAESAAVGIVVAQLALAETGTVMVYSHAGCGRSVTLLPYTTVFIIPEENIVPHLTQSMDHLQQKSKSALPSSINFISGASSTSDIELVRVQGVHGPVKIAFVILRSFA
ncbi:MAG: lactate utilization protein C [Desulfobacteraceae bacterium]|jgi:L-lactate dehydrogenase complex protein LldG